MSEKDKSNKLRYSKKSMDYKKDIEEMQKRFLENPRESIENLLVIQKGFIRGLSELPYAQQNPDMFTMFMEFRKQYSDIVGKMLEEGLISSGSFKDDKRDIAFFQVVAEMKKNVSNYDEKKVPLDENMHLLKKSYASLSEILWAKLKRIIFFAGLNPEERHLNLKSIKTNLTKLEKKYLVDLLLVKNTLDGELRNYIHHEKTYFEHPNFLVFMKEVGGRWEESYRINDKNLINELLKIFTILSAFHYIECLVLITHLERLVKLNDEELDEYCKTGKLTEGMRKKYEKI